MSEYIVGIYTGKRPTTCQKCGGPIKPQSKVFWENVERLMCDKCLKKIIDLYEWLNGELEKYKAMHAAYGLVFLN